MVSDRLEGGVSDEYPPSSYDQREIRRGQRVEMEHTNNPAIAREIASDHLAENPRYYRVLPLVERGEMTEDLCHELGGRMKGRFRKKRCVFDIRRR